MCEYNVYAQCVQLGMSRSRSIALEGRLMDCLHGLPPQYHPENTQQKKGGQQKNHKNAADIHLESYFKGTLTNALVSV
jgi:hypothetical protein